MVTLHRDTERRLAWLIGSVLVTIVLSGTAAAAAGRQQAVSPGLAPVPSTARTAVPSRVLTAGDIVPPTPVTLVFAKPVPPSRTPARPAPRTTRTAAVTRLSRPVYTETVCSGPQWRERRGAAALASLLHPTPSGVSLSFLPGGGALKGMTHYDTHHVDVYVGSCDAESAALLRHVVAHEMGHAWDSLHMTGALRADYLAARGIPASTPWFGCNECQDFATPAGDFAETYAQWQRGAGDSRSTTAAPASPNQLAELGARFFAG